jgi:hypothetical protein
MLADKVTGDLAGVWLLVAEHLRLGTWDLLCGWTKQATARAEPRLALQLVHEAAVYTTCIRAERTLHSRGGFELVNGDAHYADGIIRKSNVVRYPATFGMTTPSDKGR